MFCVKCGTELKATDMHCPNCGAKNENYKVSVSKKDKAHNQATKKQKVPLPYMIGSAAILVVLAVMGCFFLIKSNVKHSTNFKQQGLSAYIDSDGNANFYVDDETITFHGDYQMGTSTPDHSKFLMLDFDGALVLYSSSKDEPQIIANNVLKISKLTNEGCCYSVNDNVTIDDILDILNDATTNTSITGLKREFHNKYDESLSGVKKFYKDKTGRPFTGNSIYSELYMYYFSSGEHVDLQTHAYGYVFSDNSLTFINIDNNKLSLYKNGDKSMTELCNVDFGANLVGVSDDGTMVIWSEDKDNSLLIYMMKNGVPERIGKFDTNQKYVYPSVTFLENGFLVNSLNKNIILCKNNVIQTLSVNEPLNSYTLLDDRGDIVTKSPCNSDYFYITGSNGKSSSKLFKIGVDGSIDEIISDLNQQYFIKQNNIYYINSNNDFYMGKINQSGISKLECVTTEVSKLRLSSNGTFAYIAKSDGLYYWETNDSSCQLHQISNNFPDNADLYITDSDKTIFYITDKYEITGSYYDIGTLYCYSAAAGESTEIGKDVMLLKANDTEYISSANPIIVQYAALDDNKKPLYNICTLQDNQIKTLLKSVKHYY